MYPRGSACGGGRGGAGWLDSEKTHSKKRKRIKRRPKYDRRRRTRESKREGRGIESVARGGAAGFRVKINTKATATANTNAMSAFYAHRLETAVG